MVNDFFDLPDATAVGAAYTSMQSEIEKNVSKGMDINAYVKIGDKGVKTSQRQWTIRLADMCHEL